METSDLDRALIELEHAENRLRHAVAGQDQRAAMDALNAYTTRAEAVLRGTVPSELDLRLQKVRSALQWALRVTRAARADAEAQLRRIRAIGSYTSCDERIVFPGSRMA